MLARQIQKLSAGLVSGAAIGARRAAFDRPPRISTQLQRAGLWRAGPAGTGGEAAGAAPGAGTGGASGSGNTGEAGDSGALEPAGAGTGGSLPLPTGPECASNAVNLY